MAEYFNVEKPFLEKLRELDWQVIDHGIIVIPEDPSISLRTSFKEVVLKDEFKKKIRDINRVNGDAWLKDKQLDHLFNEVTSTERSNLSLLEANKRVFEHLIGKQKLTIDVNENTGDKDVLVKIIDFDNWDDNSFIAINQFRVDTPGGPRESIIPDIVLFVNGLPFVVIECKEVDLGDPLSQAIDQIQRYNNTREDDFGIKEGEEKLFHYNLFSIATHGEEARFGTITGSFEHYNNWKDIFPEKYKTIDIECYTEEEVSRYNANGLNKEPKVRQEVVIHGMLNKEILLDVLRHFTVFLEIKSGVEIKAICRYQQYRAVGRIIDRLRIGENPFERSGVVWHTQGSGKSLTMVFLVKKMRSQTDLKDYKIIFLVDRSDLEFQLSETARLTGEFQEKNVVSSRRDLAPKLSTDSSDLNMVMIHKFIQDEIKHSKALMKAYVKEGKVPEFKPFDVVNKSDRILILIDEAHRTQGGDMGDNLFIAFPNSVKVAFTGTPLLTERHKLKTHERFGGTGEFIDTYKIRQSVKDRATLDIVYIGKTTKDNIIDSEAFDREFEDVFKGQNKEEKLKIQQDYGTMQAYLENMDRLRKIADDLVNHYVDEILPNGYKAMVVSSSVLAAARYENLIKQALQKRIKVEKNKTEQDKELIKQIEFIEACTVVTKQDNNELGYITAARNKAKEKNAVENFKKDFDYSVDESGAFNNPNTGIAFLCVCDRLLTGFDVPIAQVMYLDKSLREHDLLQTIARVNRTKEDKSHGIVVDYYGISNNLREALNIYGAEDEEDIKDLLAYFRDIDKEIPVLEARYNRLLQHFEDNGISQIKEFVNQDIPDQNDEYIVAEKCIELAESIPFRAQFDTYLKAFFDSLDLLFNTTQAKNYYIAAKRFGYLLIRMRERYKDPTMDLKWAKAKVRKMIDKHLETLGINSKIPPVYLLSEDFPKEVNKHNRNTKSKASEMEHAIRRHIKINLEKDPGLYTRFIERMKQIMERYKGNWEQIVDELEQLRKDIAKGREHDEEKGLKDQELPFFDIIIMYAYDNKKPEEFEKEKVKKIIIQLVEMLQDAINKPRFWKVRDTEIRKLQGMVDDLFDYSGIPSLSSVHQKLSIVVLNLAKRRHQELTGEK